MPISLITDPDSIEVDIIESLGDVPTVTGLELRRKFDKGSSNIKDYLETEVPKINSSFTQVTSEISSVKGRVTDLETSSTSIESEATKVYTNASTTTASTSSPEIRFVKSTAPTMSNYGANLPVGSIVFVYD